jgi:hypothetical protein
VLEQRLGEAWRSRGAGGLLVRGGSLESHNWRVAQSLGIERSSTRKRKMVGVNHPLHTKNIWILARHSTLGSVKPRFWCVFSTPSVQKRYFRFIWI